MQGDRERVVAAIRAALGDGDPLMNASVSPRVRVYLERHGLRPNPEAMDRLARHIADVIPPGLYRQGCGPWDWEDGDGFACACAGVCVFWQRAERPGFPDE